MKREVAGGFELNYYRIEMYHTNNNILPILCGLNRTIIGLKVTWKLCRNGITLFESYYYRIKVIKEL